MRVQGFRVYRGVLGFIGFSGFRVYRVLGFRALGFWGSRVLGFRVPNCQDEGPKRNSGSTYSWALMDSTACAFQDLQDWEAGAEGTERLKPPEPLNILEHKSPTHRLLGSSFLWFIFRIL